MMPTHSFLAVTLFSFSIAIGAVLTPGPITTTIISQAPRLGWKAGLLVSIGHAIMEFVMVVSITLGLSGVLGAPTVQVVIAILGGLLLLYMGTTMLVDALKGKMKLPAKEEGAGRLSSSRMMGLGILTSLSNPFWYAWWMTAAAIFLLQAKAVSWLLVVGFFIGHIAADFIWNVLLATVVGSGKKFITDRIYAVLISFCGAYLVYLAATFLITGYQGITG
jgi:threonine/homoserine/homoserine lactone efflux protein